jgi:signal transduction histidine kinase
MPSPLAAIARSSEKVRTNPTDLGVALGLLVILLGEAAATLAGQERLIAVGAAPVVALPLMWRRRSPLLVAGLSLGAFAAQTALGLSSDSLVAPLGAILLASYGLGAYTEAREALAGLALAALLAATSVIADPGGFGPSDLLFAGILLGGAWSLGRVVHARTIQASRQEQRARELETTADERARQAVEAERRRIARELHDVIAHGLSLMVLQAGAAERVLATSPERAAEPLRIIQETGRLALTDMRQLLSVLRTPGQQTGLDPQPRLEDLESLLARVRESGLEVRFHQAGVPYTPPVGVALSIYRIVQEALTNTIKHAHARRVEVTVRYLPSAIEVEVVDDGSGGRAEVNGTGGGLIGMRERVEVFGGDFHAGRTVEGGFAVRARLPVPGASPVGS